MYQSYLERLPDVIDAARSSPYIVQHGNIPLFEVILQYCKDNNLMVANRQVYESADVGGSQGAPKMADRAVDGPAKFYSSDILVEYGMNKRPFTTFKIYGTAIFKHANALANMIAESITIYVELSTILKNQLFAMKINGAAYFITFVNIQPMAVGGIQPYEGKWYPPEMELLTIYNMLYMPQHYGDWSDIKNVESRCWELATNRVRPPNRKPTRAYPHNAAIMKWLRNRTDCVLIGPRTTTHPSAIHYKIQFVTCAPLADVVSDLTRTMGRLGTSITSKIVSAGLLPDEYRMFKAVVSTNTGEYIAEIYNTASYEIIPFIMVDNVQVAMPYVVLRFMWVDIISDMIRVASARGGLEGGSSVSGGAGWFYTSDWIDVMNHIRANGMLKVDMPKYMGVYISDFIDKKQLQLRSGYRIYYPLQYKKNNGDYRSI